MKIKIGTYVRTKEGLIAKCEDIWEEDDGTIFYDFDNDIFRIDYESYTNIITNDNFDIIEKSSKNIKDLIKKGDIVETYFYKDSSYLTTKIRMIGEVVGDTTSDVTINVGFRLEELKLIEIKSILTKELFEKYKYEINH